MRDVFLVTIQGKVTLKKRHQLSGYTLRLQERNPTTLQYETKDSRVFTSDADYRYAKYLAYTHYEKLLERTLHSIKEQINDPDNW